MTLGEIATNAYGNHLAARGGSPHAYVPPPEQSTHSTQTVHPYFAPHDGGYENAPTGPSNLPPVPPHIFNEGKHGVTPPPPPEVERVNGAIPLPGRVGEQKALPPHVEPDRLAEANAKYFASHKAKMQEKEKQVQELGRKIKELGLEHGNYGPNGEFMRNPKWIVPGNTVLYRGEVDPKEGQDPALRGQESDYHTPKSVRGQWYTSNPDYAQGFGTEPGKSGKLNQVVVPTDHLGNFKKHGNYMLEPDEYIVPPSVKPDTLKNIYPDGHTAIPLPGKPSKSSQYNEKDPTGVIPKWPPMGDKTPYDPEGKMTPAQKEIARRSTGPRESMEREQDKGARDTSRFTGGERNAGASANLPQDQVKKPDPLLQLKQTHPDAAVQDMHRGMLEEHEPQVLKDIHGAVYNAIHSSPNLTPTMKNFLVKQYKAGYDNPNPVQRFGVISKMNPKDRQGYLKAVGEGLPPDHEDRAYILQNAEKMFNAKAPEGNTREFVDPAKKRLEARWARDKEMEENIARSQQNIKDSEKYFNEQRKLRGETEGIYGNKLDPDWKAKPSPNNMGNKFLQQRTQGGDIPPPTLPNKPGMVPHRPKPLSLDDKEREMIRVKQELQSPPSNTGGMKTTKLISGGQTGADEAGLKVGKEMGLQTGGWATKGFRTQSGNRPDYAHTYGLKEHPSWEYQPRTEANVRDSDATVRFAHDFNSYGERATLNAIMKHGKPYHDFNMYSKTPEEHSAKIDALRKFISQHGTVNIAGNSEKTAPGIGKQVQDILRQVFKK